MNTFSMTRLWQVVKFDLLLNKKNLISVVGGLTFGYSIALVVMYVLTSRAFLYESEIGNEALGTVLPFLSLSIIFFGSTIFSCMKTKQMRTIYLTMPATNLEKYVSRLLLITLGITVCAICSLIAADAIRWILHLVMQRGPGGSVLVPLLSAMFKMPAQSAVILLLAMYWSQSVYILGASVFRRHSWVMTTATMFVLTILFSMGVTWLSMHLMETVDLSEYQINETAAFWWGVVVLVALTFMNYFISYRLFRRMQVINNKWLSL